MGKEFKDYLTHGMQYGSESVSIPHSHYKLPAPTCPPLDCIQYDQNVVQEYLDHEGRVIGPLAITDHPEVHVSVIPKKHQPNKWRLILDLSHPDHGSINDGIDKPP